jgi:hypothetical protein
MATTTEEGRMQDDTPSPSPIPWRAAERAHRTAQQARLAANTRSIQGWALAGLAMPVLLAAVYGWERHRNAQVVSRSPIGTLQDLRPVHSPRGFKPVVLVVKTSTGSVALHDPLNLPVGAPLVLERRASGRSYVCDARRTQCAQVGQAAMSGQGAAAGAT